MNKILVSFLLLLVGTTHGYAQTVRGDRFQLNTGPCLLRSGSGAPSSLSTCDIYINTADGTVWMKGLSGPPSADLFIQPQGDIILSPSGDDVIPAATYSENLGRLDRKFLTLHAAELWVETLVAQNTIATIGGRILVGPTTVFVQDVGTGDTTIHVKHNEMVSGDRAYSEADGKVEFFAITSSASSHSGHFDYTVTRNLDGSGANQWFAGDALFNTGTTGDGWLDIHSVAGMKSGSSQLGPTIVMNIRGSGTYNDWSPRMAMGRLDNLYGTEAGLYTSTSCGGGPCFGVGIGVQTGARVVIDPTNGVRLYDGTNTPRVIITPAGSALFDGGITVGTGRNVLRNSECRVGTEGWTDISTNSGLTISSGFALASFRLNDESNTCYFTVTGTPANGTLTQSVYTEFFPVVTGLKYEASSYLGTNGGTSDVIIAWYDSSFAFLSANASSVCTTASGGGVTLASWCRTGVIATAPASATYAKMGVRHLYNGAAANPFLFYVRQYFGEAKSTQTGLTEWAGAGTTEITGGLIKTDTVDARIIAADTITASEIAANAITTSELNADSVTSAKIAANTIVAADIAADTITASEIAANAITTSEIAANTITASDIAAASITATELNVSTLSAISANMGTLTAGTISGGLIDGAEVRAGSGDEVILNTSGITFTAGTGANNQVKWSDGSFVRSSSDDITVVGSDFSRLVSGGNEVIAQGTNNTITLSAVDEVRISGLIGTSVGDNGYVCHENDGGVYSSDPSCDGLVELLEVRVVSTETVVANLRAEVAELRALVASLLAERQR